MANNTKMLVLRYGADVEAALDALVLPTDQNVSSLVRRIILEAARYNKATRKAGA